MSKDTKSFEAHNAQYKEHTIEEIRAAHKVLTDNRAQYYPDNPIGNVMDSCKDNVKMAVDIGCGNGFGPNLLAIKFDYVYAIEPSLAALNIAKYLYRFANITWINSSGKHVGMSRGIIWINGFAEEQLGRLDLPHAALFYSACVLSHLQDETVSAICHKLNQVAKPGSRLAFSENWGPSFDDGNLWRCRTQEWWRSQFPGWELTFEKTVGISGNQGHKRITGIKLS